MCVYYMYRVSIRNDGRIRNSSRSRSSINKSPTRERERAPSVCVCVWDGVCENEITVLRLPRDEERRGREINPLLFVDREREKRV